VLQGRSGGTMLQKALEIRTTLGGFIVTEAPSNACGTEDKLTNARVGLPAYLEAEDSSNMTSTVVMPPAPQV
jgi:hypothetical protein